MHRHWTLCGSQPQDDFFSSAWQGSLCLRKTWASLWGSVCIYWLLALARVAVSWDTHMWIMFSTWVWVPFSWAWAPADISWPPLQFWQSSRKWACIQRLEFYKETPCNFKNRADIRLSIDLGGIVLWSGHHLASLDHLFQEMRMLYFTEEFPKISSLLLWRPFQGQCSWELSN